MPPTRFVPRNPDQVKAQVLAVFEREIVDLLSMLDEDPSVRDVEAATRRTTIRIWAVLFGSLLGLLCRAAALKAIRRAGLTLKEVKFRFDRDYWISLMSSMGPVLVPLFAYRAPTQEGMRAQTPARALFPLHPACLSTEMCLEFEARMGMEQRFGCAACVLAFFTGGALKLEDTTIAAHLYAVGSLVTPEWTYQEPEKIKKCLRELATRDRKTGRPIIYFSTDGVAQRLLVNDTWTPEQRMVNGIRIWCINRKNGATIHIGGEYITGDCHAVGRSVQRLIDSGVLPRDGDYGDGLICLLAIPTDGMPWFEDHIFPLLPWAQKILDAYHMLDRLGAFARAVHPDDSKAARKLYLKLRTVLLGPERHRKRQKKRKGHKKRRKGTPPPQPAVGTPPAPMDAQARALLILLVKVHGSRKDLSDHVKNLLGYIGHNTFRTDYREYEGRGLQRGSGAMESLHRTQQCRVKMPGIGWLPEHVEAVYSLRMLRLAGRWGEFWSQPDLYKRVAEALKKDQKLAA